MPAEDFIHQAVKNALIKDGWRITHDPYHIKFEGDDLYADLAAERSFAAEREGRKIVVEIKSFLGRSPLREFQQALGQYLLYQSILEIQTPEVQVFLAVGDNAYDTVLNRKSLAPLLEKSRVAIIVVNLETEEVIQWIERLSTER